MSQLVSCKTCGGKVAITSNNGCPHCGERYFMPDSYYEQDYAQYIAEQQEKYGDLREISCIGDINRLDLGMSNWVRNFTIVSVDSRSEGVQETIHWRGNSTKNSLTGYSQSVHHESARRGILNTQLQRTEPGDNRAKGVRLKPGVYELVYYKQELSAEGHNMCLKARFTITSSSKQIIVNMRFSFFGTLKMTVEVR